MTNIHGANNAEAIRLIEEMVLSIARLLVDDPNEVTVHRAEGEGFYHLEVVCTEEDAGALIGSRGRHAKAIRLLAMRAAAQRNIRVTVNMLSRDQHALGPK